MPAVIRKAPSRRRFVAPRAGIAIAGLMLAAMPAVASARPARFHIAAATVTTNYAYSYTATDAQGDPYSASGGESASLTMSAVDRSADAFGIHTARLKGSFHGSYTLVDSGGGTSCPSYTLDPGAVQEYIQLTTVPLSRHRLEINAGLGPGQTDVATQELAREYRQVQSTCGVYPPNLGYGLTYNPAPDNVHTPQCSGIAQGCEIFSARAFRRRRVVVRIGGTVPVAPGFTAIPAGGSGHDTYTWQIAVTLVKG